MQPTCDHDLDVCDFDDILAATKVLPDDHGDAPWDNCDGFDHTIERATRDDEDKPGFVIWDRGPRLITLDDKATADEYNWYRRNGASKQVAFEHRAHSIRTRLAQLVKWYSDGWEYYGVTCDFMDAHSSCWGYDDYAFAESQREEHALEVAHQLEARGVVVRGMPEQADYKTLRRAARIEQIRANANAFNVTGR